MHSSIMASYGPVTRIKSKFLNDTAVIYNSVRNPGYVYKFGLKKDTEYRCCRCRELGKQRSVRIVNDMIIARKNPEDDHHPDCVPIAEDDAAAEEFDRDMRHEVC